MKHRALWKTLYGKLMRFADRSAVCECAITAHWIDPNKHLIHCFLVWGAQRGPEDAETKKSIGLRENREKGRRESLGGWKEPIQSDWMMIACVVINFLYAGPQEIGTLVNNQFNQYHQALLYSSNFLKSCWLVAAISINNFRKEILQRCWFRKKSSGPKNTRFSHFVDTQWCFGEVGEMSFKWNTVTLLCDCSAHSFLSPQAWKRNKRRFKLGQIESTVDYI